MRLLLPFLLVLFVISCEVRPDPEPINYGKDSCAWCRMIIADAGFAAELKTKKGKVYKFDAIECLAAFVLSGSVKEEDILAMWVADFANKGNLIPVQKAKFLVSPNLRSPMGLNIAAFSSEEDLKEALRVFRGKVLEWKDVLEYVREKWGEKLSSGHSSHTH
ncbi:MAG: nitrous oxide reductase [Aquificae bacterium]|nr:nitrous oxide reductase [Aquificota bacterium]